MVDFRVNVGALKHLGQHGGFLVGRGQETTASGLRIIEDGGIGGGIGVGVERGHGHDEGGEESNVGDEVVEHFVDGRDVV